MQVRSAIDFYERHPISADIIRAKLQAARGNLDNAAPDELLPHDQDHYGGLAANDALAKAARLKPGQEVADFCAGLAGPARYMATQRDLAPMLRKEALKKSARLGVVDNPGVPVGRLHLGKQMLYASFEDMMLLIAGPRVGKSTSLVIPAIMAAPGAVVTTSNKRDVLDATRDVRAAEGHVWVFDPQRVAFEDATWWWNPLSYVTDDTKAAKLATHFASGTRALNAKTDAYFDGKGQELLSDLLLAAAVGNRPISEVLLWLTSVEDETPVELLHDNGYPTNARAVRGIMNTAEKARDGIYSTAQGMAVCLKSAATADWVNARPNDTRPQFVPETFVTSTETLYTLSKEGAGTAGPLVTALTAATIEAAEEHAARSRGGRLATAARSAD